MDPMEGLRAAKAAVDAYYKERGIFQGKFGFGRSPALVVIDMAYGWTDAAYAGGSARPHAPPLAGPPAPSPPRRRRPPPRRHRRGDPTAPVGRTGEGRPRHLHHVAVLRRPVVQVG